MRTAPRSALPVMTLLFAGCAVQRGIELPELDGWATRQAVLARTHRWEFHGRIAVSAGSEGFNGKLWWWQRDDDFRATVSGPLGVGTVRIAGLGHEVTVTDKDGRVTELADAEADLKAMYGWTIPIDSLRYWALGIPAPSSPARTEFADDGRLSRLEQRDWIVDIGQYAEGGGQAMPRRITASSADTRVRLVIDNWTFY